MKQSSDPLLDFPELAEMPPVPTAQQKAAVKFAMYVRIQELKQISQGLRRLLLLPEVERLEWLGDHEDFLSEMMESFLSETVNTIDGLQLDQESLALSVELVTTMRDAMAMIQNLMQQPRSS